MMDEILGEGHLLSKLRRRNRGLWVGETADVRVCSRELCGDSSLFTAVEDVVSKQIVVDPRILTGSDWADKRDAHGSLIELDSN